MPTFRFTPEIITLHPRDVFRISRNDEAEVHNVLLRIEAEGISGQGEASPNPFYQETAGDVRARLSRLNSVAPSAQLETREDLLALSNQWWEFVRPSRAALCALDIALWDWLARKNNVPVSRLALHADLRPVKSCCTIGLSTPEELERKVEELRQYPFIKIKMDQKADLAVVRYVRDRTNAALCVDANCSWGKVDVTRTSKELADLGVTFIEQPLPPEQNERMPAILAASALPIIADESCVTREDVEVVAGRFSGFNIKLVKCGGLSLALEMLRRGGELGLRTMVGCMLESSLLISAGAVVGQQTDFADLDGAWLLRDDPFSGVQFDQGFVTVSKGPGLGVKLK